MKDAVAMATAIGVAVFFGLIWLVSILAIPAVCITIIWYLVTH